MNKERRKLLVVLFGGLLFGFGLAFGNMTKPEVVLRFLQLQDLGLVLLMAFAILVVAPTYYYFSRKGEKPRYGDKFDCHQKIFDRNTIIGAVIFGVGWGISGLCPGSAIASIGIGNYKILMGIAAIFAGAYIQGRFMKK
ncbi:MAG: YeeE/YedE family protein [Nanoarchaeota archaeon]|nr:YeeE/YedE family protein [Nanoarchaeota archaeon]